MKTRILLIGFVLLLTAVGTLAFAAKNKEDLAKAELSVRKLTCVACARKIEKALAEVPGIVSTQVDVTAGRVSVSFAPAQVSAGTIAEAISAAGYPAGLLRVIAADAEKTAAVPAPKPVAGAGCACCN